jgi:hypothetical protein
MLRVFEPHSLQSRSAEELRELTTRLMNQLHIRASMREPLRLVGLDG